MRQGWHHTLQSFARQIRDRRTALPLKEALLPAVPVEQTRWKLERIRR